MTCPFGPYAPVSPPTVTEPQAANTRKKTPMHSAPVRRIQKHIHKRFSSLDSYLPIGIGKPFPPEQFPIDRMKRMPTRFLRLPARHNSRHAVDAQNLGL